MVKNKKLASVVILFCIGIIVGVLAYFFLYREDTDTGNSSFEALQEASLIVTQDDSGEAASMFVFEVKNQDIAVEEKFFLLVEAGEKLAFERKITGALDLYIEAIELEDLAEEFILRQSYSGYEIASQYSLRDYMDIFAEKYGGEQKIIEDRSQIVSVDEDQ